MTGTSQSNGKRGIIQSRDVSNAPWSGQSWESQKNWQWEEGNALAWTIYTGSLVSHHPQTQLSRVYTEHAETSIYGVFKKYITGPVFAALGNHDYNPEDHAQRRTANEPQLRIPHVRGRQWRI